MEVLLYFGAIPNDERVVIGGKFISAGGVTSGIDGSLVVVSFGLLFLVFLLYDSRQASAEFHAQDTTL
jgi:hypothetical protein